VAQKVTTGVYRGVSTSELDNLAAETAASMTATHPDYALVSADNPLSAFNRHCCQCHRAPSAGRSSMIHSTCSAADITCVSVAVLQLAARIAVSNLHKSTLKSFTET
jgi:hypothetical protein